MISYDTFRKYVRLHIAEYLPRDKYRGWTLKETQVCSINRVIQSFHLQPPGSDVKALPSFHFQDAYSRVLLGEDIESAMRHIARLLQFYAPQDMTDMILDEGEEIPVREKDLQMALINRKRNKTLLKHTPHKDFLDLAAIAVSVRPGPNNDYGLCIISEDIAADMGLTAEELLQTACENTFRQFPAKFTRDGLSVYAACEKAFCGAACLLDKEMLRSLSEEWGSDLVILPDSLQGVIVRPRQDLDEPAMTEAFRQILAISVDFEDYLSDTPYLYERETETLRLCEDAPAAPSENPAA